MDERKFPVSTANLPDISETPSAPRRGRPPKRLEDLPCDGCGLAKTPGEFSKFLVADLELDADVAAPYLCDQCATYGPPLEDPLGELSKKERQAMLLLASGCSIHESAKRLDVDPAWLRSRLSGKDSGIFRQAFQRMMMSDGLGPEAILDVFKRAISGKRYQWNPATSDFEEFEDLNVQMKVAGMLVKLFNLEHPTELSRNVDETGGPQMVVNINTNVGDGQEAERNEYEVVGERVDD